MTVGQTVKRDSAGNTLVNASLVEKLKRTCGRCEHGGNVRHRGRGRGRAVDGALAAAGAVVTAQRLWLLRYVCGGCAVAPEVALSTLKLRRRQCVALTRQSRL